MINRVRTTGTNQPGKKKDVMLPVIFINREGDPETGGVPRFVVSPGGDTPSFADQDPRDPGQETTDLPEAAASNRLSRALFETGQLIVTPKDGLTRICFAGIGDPEHLFVESVPRDVTVPTLEHEHDFPGCLCSLPQAQVILKRIYRGASSATLASFLDNLAAGRHRRRQMTEDRRRAA